MNQPDSPEEFTLALRKAMNPQFHFNNGPIEDGSELCSFTVEAEPMNALIRSRDAAIREPLEARIKELEFIVREQQGRYARECGKFAAELVAIRELGRREGVEQAAKAVWTIGNTDHRAFHHRPYPASGVCEEVFCSQWNAAVAAIRALAERQP